MGNIRREFGLVGKSLKHSFSKNYFEEKNKKDFYELFELDDISQIRKIIVSKKELCGLNITIPYKEEVIKYLDRIEKEANQIGSVNVIKIIRGEKLILEGYNTDAVAFEKILKKLKLTNKKVLILGTGGVAKSIAFILNKNKINYSFVSRNPKRNELSYEGLDKNLINGCEMIINTTPLGMFPNEKSFPPIPYEFLTKNHLLFDLIYNPSETEFLKKGKLLGARVINGMEMLKCQAELSWKIWEI